MTVPSDCKHRSASRKHGCIAEHGVRRVRGVVSVRSTRCVITTKKNVEVAAQPAFGIGVSFDHVLPQSLETARWYGR